MTLFQIKAAGHRDPAMIPATTTEAEDAMHSIVKAIIGLSALAVVTAAPAYSKNAAHSTCPTGYAPLGEICISAASGDIVLPIKAKTPPAQARAGR